MNTPVWFPALRDLLERKLGPYLPPHPLRLLMGSALAALLAAGLTGAGYLTFRGVTATWQGLQAITASVGKTIAELSAPPPPQEPEASSKTSAAAPAGSPTEGLPSARPGRQPGKQPSMQPGTQAALQTGMVPSGSSSDSSSDSSGASAPPAPPDTSLPASASLIPPAPYPVLDDPLVVRESIVPDALPYAESADISLADSVKQVDFALMQTLARLGLDRSRLDVLHVERRQTAKGSFVLQRLRVYMSGSEGDFVQSLNDTLQAWADIATLHVQRKGEWIDVTAHPEVLALLGPASAAQPLEAGEAAGDKPLSVTAQSEQASPPAGPLARVMVDGEITHEVFFTPVGAVFVPPPPDTEPRLTIVIDDMGANMEAVHKLLELDLPITFSIIPHLQHARSTALAAHKAGQEVLLHQPMEPMQAPYVKTGPGALMLGMNAQTMQKIMNANIAKVPYATGVNNHMGSRLTSSEEASRAVCAIAAPAGLFVLDSLTHTSSVLFRTARSQNLMAFQRDFFLDDGLTSVRSVRNVLENAERAARRTGQAIVIGHPRPETLAALKAWSLERDASVAVVPLRYQSVNQKNAD